MLRFDRVGRIVQPGLIIKRWGGDFDQRGIPADCAIPTTGDHAGVSIANSGMRAKILQRPADTPGLARVQGPEISVDADVKALRVRACIEGAGSGIETGQTHRDFSIGFLADDGEEGGFLKSFSSYGRASSSHNFIGLAGGAETVSDDINIAISGFQTRYCMELWMVRRPAGAGWQLAYAEGGTRETPGLPAKYWNFNGSEVGIAAGLRPVIEWDWRYPTGSFFPKVYSFDGEIHYY